MTRGTYHQAGAGLVTTHLRVGRILLFSLLMLVALGAAAVSYLRWQTQGVRAEAQADTGWQPTQKAQYTPDPPPKHEPAPVVEKRDPHAERWALLQAQLAKMQAELMALKHKPEPKPAPAAKPLALPAKHTAMLHIHHGEQATTTDAKPGTYILAPAATKIACQVETVMHSDAGETFTAKTTTPVYDTATGQHLLIPQHSTILGQYEAEGLLYGNERLPTLSLSLTLPNGQSVDLGKAPVTNQAGTSGLASRVDQHWGRLFGAIFIGGALRGGAMAAQASLAGLGPAAHVATGITQSGATVIQRQQGRALDTRPTIHVEAGELCHVILTTPLQLPAAG